RRRRRPPSPRTARARRGLPATSPRLRAHLLGGRRRDDDRTVAASACASSAFALARRRRPRREWSGMVTTPGRELLVLGQHRVDQLVEHVLRVLPDEGRVRKQRLVVLVIEARAVLHHLLAACPRFDQRHDGSSQTWVPGI